MNIDEFLDSVAANNLSATPPKSSASGVNAVPSAELVHNVMQAKFDVVPKPMLANDSSQNKSNSASSLSDDSISKISEQFESLCVALETSLASAEYQHAFDTYIALQSALAHLHEQQKKQQRLFQDRLNLFKTRLFNSVQESTAQFQSVMQELYLQIGQIKQLVDTNQVDAATNQYASVKKTIDQLPNNFSEKKEKLQDELLKVYLYLKDRRETHTANSFGEISVEMKRFYVSAVAAIKTSNFALAQQLYEQLAAKYAQLPDGFTEQKVQLFDYVTFLHSQLSLDVTATPQTNSQTVFASKNYVGTLETPLPQKNVPPESSSISKTSAKLAQTPKPLGVESVTPITSSVEQKVTTLVQGSSTPSAAAVASNKVTSAKDTSSHAPSAFVKPTKSESPKVEAVAAASKELEPQILATDLQKSAKRYIDSNMKSSSISQSLPLNAVDTHVGPAPAASSNIKAKSKQPVQQPQPAPSNSTVVQPVITPSNSAQQLQERAKKLALRLEELKKSLD